MVRRHNTEAKTPAVTKKAKLSSQKITAIQNCTNPNAEWRAEKPVSRSTFFRIRAAGKKGVLTPIERRTRIEYCLREAMRCDN